MENLFSIGIDVGSTTVKIVILNQENVVIYKNYVRHFSEVKNTLLFELKEIIKQIGDIKVKVAITGSAGLGLAQKSNIDFVQEVHSAFLSVKKYYPDTDCVIELGGEDAKIIFLTNGVEERMNGSCAGGTGAFIDQMATLLGVSVDELDKLSLKAEKIYPIASRCGVFAKSDIQPLINQGARKEDIAASIFHSVVDQTVSGLAQGRKIEGKVLFLGGPLSFIQGLRNAFTSTLHLDEEHAIFTPLGPVFMALGAALYSQTTNKTYSLKELISLIENTDMSGNFVVTEPLFKSLEEYQAFQKRHQRSDAKYRDISTYEGDAYLGIDSGSTTTKLVLLSKDYEILYSHYVSSKGRPLDIVVEQLKTIYDKIGTRNIKIVSSAVTGYGEELIKAGLGIANGIVETVAHFKAASYFCPDVDFIIDIGGQDIKCFKIKNHAIDSIILNEACSSGCGSFIQSFAEALGYDIATFAKMGLFALHPVDLGSRCTVFMNSQVKQAQKDGASIDDISAGLSQSIIKNAIYKVIRVKKVEELGKKVVVQGGTFLNDAVLRSFERELGIDVIRPQISELMGAFGAAIYASKHLPEHSELLTRDQLDHFAYKSINSICKACTAHCQLNIINFNGGHHYISGNRCDKVSTNVAKSSLPSLYDYKFDKLLAYQNKYGEKESKALVGLPLGLNFYDQIPFFTTLFNELGFRVIFSDVTSRKTYYKGQHTIASDTACYPAKLMHGHVCTLIDEGVKTIFYPCLTYNFDEGLSDNHYNCPVVAYYPEVISANVSELEGLNFINDYLGVHRKKDFPEKMHGVLAKYFDGISLKEVKTAAEKGYAEYEHYLDTIRKEGDAMIQQAEANQMPIIVLCGRPYHLDPEINHGIDKLITSLGACIVTEDVISNKVEKLNTTVLNQWTYHARLYAAAEYISDKPQFNLVQLVSFGCGIDAITTDEVRSILEKSGKIYTQIKIDEITNLGAVKIRLRSLFAALEQ